MKSIIQFSFFCLLWLASTLLVQAKPIDREKLIQEKTQQAIQLLKQQKRQNEYLKKLRKFAQMDFVLDEFANKGKPYISDQTRTGINQLLRLLHLQTGIEYYVLITPHVPLYLKGTESQDSVQLIRKQLDDEAVTFSKNVAKAAKIGEIKVGNGALMTYVRHEIRIGSNTLPAWIKNSVTSGTGYIKDPYYYAKPLAVLGKLFNNSGIARTFSDKIFGNILNFKDRNQMLQYLSYGLLKELLVFAKVKHAPSLPDLYQVFDRSPAGNQAIWGKLKTAIANFEGHPTFQGFYGSNMAVNQLNFFKNGFETKALEQAALPLFNALTGQAKEAIITNPMDFVYDKADDKQLNFAVSFVKVILKGDNYQHEQLQPILTRFIRQQQAWVEGFKPGLRYQASANEATCLKENLHYLNLAFAQYIRDRYAKMAAEQKRKSLVIYLPLVPKAFQNHQVVKTAQWKHESIVNILPIYTTFSLDAPPIPSFTRYSEYISKALDHIQNHYGAGLTQEVAQRELEEVIRVVREYIEQKRPQNKQDAHLRLPPGPALFETQWDLSAYQPGTASITQLSDAQATIAYRAMRRAFAYFFENTQGITRNSALATLTTSSELTSVFSKKSWKQTQHKALDTKLEQGGVAGIKDFWQKASPELRENFTEALQCITKIEEVTKSCARDLLKIYLKGLFQTLPNGFPQKLSQLQGSALTSLKAPRYQLVYDFFQPLFQEFSVGKLARLMGGIVALVKGDDLVSIQTPQVLWTANVAKVMLAWFATSLDPAKLALIITQVKIIFVHAVVVVVAIYATYAVLKALWRLASWVFKTIRDFVRKEKPDEEEAKNCEEWNKSNALIVYDIVEQAVQHFFEDKDKGKAWQYKVAAIQPKHGSAVLLQHKDNALVKAFLKVACCALENQSSVTEQCALDILKMYLGNRIFNLAAAGKKAEVHQTLQEYYKKHELFFLWQIDRVLVGTLKAVDHTRYFLSEAELLLGYEVADKRIMQDLKIPKDKIEKLVATQKFIVNANAKHRNEYRENPYHLSLDNCTYCVISLDSYLKGRPMYPLDPKWPISLVRFLDFYGIDYDHTKKFEDGRSPKNGQGWIRNTKIKSGGLDIHNVKRELGKNSTGIIRIFRKNTMGHVYNIYSTSNAVVFVDLQAGQILSPNINQVKMFEAKDKKPFELLNVTGLSVNNFPPQALLLSQDDIKELIKNVQKKSVKYITKLIPKMYRFDDLDEYGRRGQTYIEKDYKSDAHPIIYYFRTVDDEKIQLWMLGKSKDKDVSPNRKLGKTLRIKISINAINYFFGSDGNLYSANDIKKFPCINNKTFIPIDKNPGARCKD